jgi:arabinose 5-phosphate isomerase
MRTDDAIPQVKLDTSVMDAMLELSRTGLGWSRSAMTR